MIFIAESWRSSRKTPFIQQYTALDTLSNILLVTQNCHRSYRWILSWPMKMRRRKYNRRKQLKSRTKGWAVPAKQEIVVIILLRLVTSWGNTAVRWEDSSWANTQMEPGPLFSRSCIVYLMWSWTTQSCWMPCERLRLPQVWKKGTF